MTELRTRHADPAPTPPSAAPALTRAQLDLRQLWRFVLAEDPATVASSAANVKSTLVALGELERWLAQYRTALEKRRGR